MKVQRLLWISKGLIVFLAFLVSSFNNIQAQSNDDCLMCHEDKTMTKVENGKKISLYVNNNLLLQSVHRNVSCGACHKDAGTDFPHAENLKAVNCGTCHNSAQSQNYAGIHGQALKLNNPFAPDCIECHGKHDVLSKNNPRSRTYKMNVPALCGTCHKEGSPIGARYDFNDQKTAENYSQNIHGKSLFESGLKVTATCNDCHGSHLILPSSSPNSSIYSKNIAATCLKCHSRIEQIHDKVIKSELWKNKPGAVPMCSDCHAPHNVSANEIIESAENQACLKCHGSDGVYKTVNGKKKSLKINIDELVISTHHSIHCVKCHSDVDNKLERPCETTKSVECSNCHLERSAEYFASGHGQAYLDKKADAPFCTDCHGTHKILSRYDDTSPTYRANIPSSCGKCHRTNGRANENTKLKEIDAYVDYSTSVHGRGLMEKGLLVSAVCTDCHTSHNILKVSDKNSSVYNDNVPETCAKCHKGIYDEYILSDHSITRTDCKEKLPSCTDCHTAHVISEIDHDKFMLQIIKQCGTCHEDLSETFLETYHGKAYELGYTKAAKCSDCHGSHNIYKASNPKSMISKENIVNTCKQCHPGANEQFASYLTHSTYSDNTAMFYTFWGMTCLLLGVFGFFGLHTLLWLPRSIKEAFKKKKNKHPHSSEPAVYYRRFSRSQRVTHIFVILSFILLALTGMTLKFSYMEWARDFALIFGGVHTAGLIHRLGAIITFGYFGFHLFSLVKMKIKTKEPIMRFIFGPNALMFNRQDLRDFKATIKWFLGRGPRPKYGRWTYWEKFDYMAVFWGVAVIGFSGLVLWFPVFFTKFLPGWTINVAQIIHSDEALLAVGFIFTIHFFNTHLRPESFPMDTVIFTGHVPIEEYKADRPREYEELEKSGKLKDVIVTKQITTGWLKMVKTFGFIFLALGLILVGLIIFSLV